MHVTHFRQTVHITAGDCCLTLLIGAPHFLSRLLSCRDNQQPCTNLFCAIYSAGGPAAACADSPQPHRPTAPRACRNKAPHASRFRASHTALLLTGASPDPLLETANSTELYLAVGLDSGADGWAPSCLLGALGWLPAQSDRCGGTTCNQPHQPSGAPTRTAALNRRRPTPPAGMKASDFERKRLNLVVVVDVSGSMDAPFDQYFYDGPGAQPGGEQNASQRVGRFPTTGWGASLQKVRATPLGLLLPAHAHAAPAPCV